MTIEISTRIVLIERIVRDYRSFIFLNIKVLYSCFDLIKVNRNRQPFAIRCIFQKNQG